VLASATVFSTVRVVPVCTLEELDELTLEDTLLDELLQSVG
jgi:hypothetical protein